MNLNLAEKKLIIERYLFVIKVRFNIKREHVTLGLPVFLAILCLSFALVTGHTFPVGETGSSASSETAEKLDAYEQLVAEIEAQENGESTAAVEENVSREGTLPLEEKSKADMDQMLVIAFIIATLPYSIDVLMQKGDLENRKSPSVSSSTNFPS